MKQPQQLLLDLPHRAALGRDDFLVTSSNAAAVRLIDDWPNWPAYGAILSGPEGSGKTHLVQVWRQISAAADAHGDGGMSRFADNKAHYIEDVSAGGFDETALFHTLNLARAERGHVLLTSRFPITEWGVALPDLASRLGALPQVSILPPDDALLRGVLVKLFTDRQIGVDESLISYLITRMPRSLAAAKLWVSEIDRRAMMAKADVTRSFVAKLVADPAWLAAG